MLSPQRRAVLPDPLHPAVVHFPIALAALMPVVALAAILVIRNGFLPARSWAVVLLLQATLAGSTWLAHETGEQEEERVEKVVAERHIEEHEEAADRLLIAGALALVVVAAGLLPGRAGGSARLVGLAAAIGVLAAAVPVGHSGGELVYRHGAANAYVQERAQPDASRGAGLP
jgi:uncharacterized membrane protein